LSGYRKVAAVGEGWTTATACEIVLALIGSAAVGAFVSSTVTIVGQWRERVARRKELLFATAVDLAKVWMSRAPTQGPAGRIMDVALVPSFHAMLTEIFGTGDLSEKHQ
jgi:hypothetical protein